MRSVLTEPFGSKIDRSAQHEHAVGSAEVDRNPATQPVEVAEPAGFGEVEGVVTLVSGVQDHLTEQQRVAIAMAEPAFDRGL